MVIKRVVISLFSLFLLGNSSAYAAEEWKEPFIPPIYKNKEPWKQNTVTAKVIDDTLNALIDFPNMKPETPKIPCVNSAASRIDHIRNRHQLEDGEVLKDAKAKTGNLAENSNGYASQNANIFEDLKSAAGELLKDNQWRKDVEIENTTEVIKIGIKLPDTLEIFVYDPQNDHVRQNVQKPGHWKALKANSLTLQYSRDRDGNIYFSSAYFVVWGAESKTCLCSKCKNADEKTKTEGHIPDMKK